MTVHPWREIVLDASEDRIEASETQLALLAMLVSELQAIRWELDQIRREVKK